MTLSTLNLLIEDTCVLAVLAYLLARGQTLHGLISQNLLWRDRLRLGLTLGVLGLSEVVFPEARTPYVFHTLLVTFAALRSGVAVGAMASAVILGGFATREPPASLGLISAALGLCLCVGEAARGMDANRRSAWVGLLAGAAAQSGVLLVYRFASNPSSTLPAAFASKGTIFANGFGLFLFYWILQDAEARERAQRYRLEAEQAHALASAAQLAALRARIHPHFLFNALTSIAALCHLSVKDAERALISLSRLLRRSLEEAADAPVPLKTERDYLEAYLQVEQLRLGERLRVEWKIAPGAEAVRLPAFALQTLVENAILHGISPQLEGGTVWISAKPRRRDTLFAVQDNGAGLKREKTPALAGSGRPAHGLPIVEQQLILLYGRRHRLRLFSVPGRGTLAVFTIPLE